MAIRDADDDRRALRKPGAREYAALALLGVANLGALQSIVVGARWLPLIGLASFAIALYLISQSDSWTADEKQPAFLFVLYAFVAVGVLRLGSHIYSEDPFPLGAILGAILFLIWGFLLLTAAIQLVILFLRVRRNGMPRA